jgi:hypothetical protein
VLIDAFFARKDWTTVVREMRQGQRRILFVVVVAMFLFAVGVSMMLSWRMDKGIGSFVRGVLLLGPFLAVPVWYAFHHRADGWRKALLGFAFFVFVMAKGPCYFGSGGGVLPGLVLNVLFSMAGILR